MGKRELLLIIVFAIVGVVVYQVTAAPPPPGSQGFSIGRIIQGMRRHVQGNRASAQIERTRTEPLDAGIQELRFVLRGIDLTVTGEDRRDAEFVMKVTSNGYDDAEAKRLAEATALSMTRAGSALVIAITYPDDGIQRAKLAIKAPARMRMRIEPTSGHLTVTGIAALEIMGMSGETSLKNISGSITMNHRGGTLDVDGAGSMKLTTRGGDVKVQNVSGMFTVQAQGGELVLQKITGPAELELRNTELRLEDISRLKAPLRVDATSGSVKIAGLRTEARIDGRDTDMNVEFDAAAPVTIYNTSDDITITPPPGGYTLDAVSTEGHITLNDGALKPDGNDTEQRVNGAVRGGGPALTLRATRGDITVRSR